MTSIPDFYNDRTVFITGSTGFMGKVLLEKLLRSCPGLRRAFVLIRPKKGQDAQTRLTEMFKSKLFDALREQQPSFSEKVVAVEGDILLPTLGLKDKDMEALIKEVNIVFHSAATVKFDEPLRLAVQMNVIGVRELLTVCHKIDKLEALVHISTAYANCDREVITESVYEPPLQPQKLLDAIEWMDEATVDTLTPMLVHPRPNTYTYTKAMAEYLLIKERGNIPTAIVRPSIVGPSWKQPIPGWVDNFNGPSGLLVAIGKGVLRVMMGNVEGTADLIPVDICVNLMIAAAWSTAIERPSTVPVFNSTTGQINKLTWGQLETASYVNYMKNPFNDPIRVPDPKFTSNRLYKFVHLYLDHYFPAWLLDVFSKIAGKKPGLMRVQSKIWKSVSTLEYFTSNQWVFINENVTELGRRLTQEDKKEFNFDVSQIHWPTYLENYCMGVKQFAMKEDLAGLPKARQQMNFLVQVNRVLKLVAILVGWRVLMSKVKVVRDLWELMMATAVRLIKSMPNFIKATSSSITS